MTFSYVAFNFSSLLCLALYKNKKIEIGGLISISKFHFPFLLFIFHSETWAIAKEICSLLLFLQLFYSCAMTNRIHIGPSRKRNSQGEYKRACICVSPSRGRETLSPFARFAFLYANGRTTAKHRSRTRSIFMLVDRDLRDPSVSMEIWRTRWGVEQIERISKRPRSSRVPSIAKRWMFYSTFVTRTRSRKIKETCEKRETFCQKFCWRSSSM